MRELVRQVSGRARAARWAEFARRFPALDEMRVLDLGGVPAQWASRRVASVVVLNLDHHDVPDLPWIEAVRGDACDPPPLGRFDLVFSNSVLEHVGGHARRAAFADTVHAAAPHHWVQTPYRYFPVEPHWLLPGFQFLPVPARAVLSRRWPYGHIRSADRATALADVTSVELIGRTELAGYFPSSEIWAERFGGWVKSLVAVA